MSQIQFYPYIVSTWLVESWPRLIVFGVLAGWLLPWLYKSLISRQKKTVPDSNKTTVELAAEARVRLVTALLGDTASADRLIDYEQSLCKPIGCGKLEAVERALLRLERDRSRVN